MDELSMSYPQDSVVITNNLNTITGGRTVPCVGYAGTVVRAGSIIVDNSGLKVLQSAVAKSVQASGDNTVDVAKGHGLIVGSAVKGGTVTSIDSTTSTTVDTITCSGTFGASIAVDEAIVNGGANAIGVTVTSKLIDENGEIQVGIMNIGEVNEAVMQAPIDADVRTALSQIIFTSDNA